MLKKCRYKYIKKIAIKRIFAVFLGLSMLGGCSNSSNGEAAGDDTGAAHADFQKLREENSDIFAWIYVPDTDIDYPVVQSSDGDDNYYKYHNARRETDPKGAIYIEAANLNDMCDFNEVLHGSSPDDGTMFAGLSNFLDRSYFEDHSYIYVYMDGNALIYYVVAAYTRNSTRLLEQYDFSYAYGCQEFIDEIYSGKSMSKNIRSGWEQGLSPEHFLITLSMENPSDASKQTVVIGCLVGDVMGKIDRYVDWSNPED